MKILFAINQLSDLVGGSLVPIEVAEYLRSHRHQCTIAAIYAENPLKELVAGSGITITDDFTSLNAFDFDMVWVQNHTAPLLEYSIGDHAARRTLFVFAHLSAQSPMEHPGLVYEPLLADVTLANSAETRSHLVGLGLREDRMRVFANPAPAKFWSQRQTAIHRMLKSVRLISNHAPAEAVRALEILESAGISPRFVGRGGHFVARVTADMIGVSSVIVSIGKSVQYAIACGVPPYVYDRFGGPGYLSADNFERAAEANFSGRCCRRIVTADQMAKEIIDGFDDACRFMASLPEHILDRYRLEPFVDGLLSAIATAPTNLDRRADLERQRPLLLRERAMATALQENFRGHKRRTAQAHQLYRKEVERLAKVRSRRSS